jgi:hypothetical protein
MQTNWAEENLKTIRTLMERSALYRRALAPVMLLAGTVGIAGGIIGWGWKINSNRSFSLLWIGMAAFCLTGSFLLLRRQALKESEPFWSPPTRRIAQALLPPFVIALILAIVFSLFPTSEQQAQRILVMSWTWLFGCGLCAAGFFMSRGIKLFGWLFILSGCVLLVCCLTVSEIYRATSPHLLMGSIFGGLHLAYGIYLYLTEQRKNAA